MERAYEATDEGKWCPVAMCFGKDVCEAYTKKIAQCHNAVDYMIEPVAMLKADEPGWRGLIRLNQRTL